tara:strand:- start:50 stop:733 length:684 start_codon:yes stop_codon:yes gene_type:complete
MSDVFGTQNSKATQAVIDAASKILMGVKDDETAKAQTEEEHPAIDPKNQEDVQEGKKMSSKEKMAKGLYNEKKKMDPVGNEDGDVDNDGDMDDSDKFLMKRRKAIKKAMAKEGFELPGYVVDAIEEALAEDPDFEVQLDEADDLDAGSASKALMHDCAKHVVHKEHGEGQCVPGMHTLEEGEDGVGFVTHYDVMFGDTIVEDVPVEDLEIVSEMHHGHPMKKEKKKK